MQVDPGQGLSARRRSARAVVFGLVACTLSGCATDLGSRAQVESTAPPVTGEPAQATRAPEDQTQSADSTAAAVEEAAATDASTSEKWLHGSFGLRYRGRTNGDDQDHELSGVLALDVADPKGSAVTGHVLARMDVDLEDLDEGEAFEDLSDTYDQAVVSKLYLAYADIALDKDAGKSPGTFRVGRQSDPLLPEFLRLDGVSYLTSPMGKADTTVGVYGGVPVHLYDSSREGDRAFGTFVEGEPWKGGRARVDWMHLEDEEVLGEGKDDLLRLGVWHALPEHWRFEGEFSHLENDPRDLRLRAFYDTDDAKTIVRAGYYQLLETQTANVTELDPYYEQLLDYFPYRQTTLTVSRVLGDHVVVDAGVDVRRVTDSGDVGEFNRDWERYYTTATWNDLSTQGLALSLTADLWNDEDRDQNSFGADLSYAANERWKAAIGTYYSLYKYHFLELDEVDDVRTYYVRTTRKVSDRLGLEAQFEYEDDDLDDYYTLRLGALWRF